MQWTWVDSSAMRRLGYESSTFELGIEYPSGDVYVYLDVPPEEYEAIMAAESKGTYLNQVFKPKEYRYRIVKRGHEPAA